MFINDLDHGVTGDISKFADYTKVGRFIRSDNGVVVLQEKINGFYE